MRVTTLATTGAFLLGAALAVPAPAPAVQQTDQLQKRYIPVVCEFLCTVACATGPIDCILCAARCIAVTADGGEEVDVSALSKASGLSEEEVAKIDADVKAGLDARAIGTA
ncbi:hypothetical protein B0T16DRAFT_502975 [Cercophora newfieldiana]|uniref:Uncharacterized protein n=1 Tax=Cercophora newfieldiana TaxID=92897 RepID=A0AA40D2C7_9PEZI|nr:hypothetical protein B0T16DRAFT_502975 [Cercophora newfieldiana]